MRAKARALWPYRPRVLTLIVLVVSGAAMVLANLSDGAARDNPGPTLRATHGWPLVWHWHNIAMVGYFDFRIHSWEYRSGRLATDALLWLALLVAPAAACEWSLRRYRPGFRWSLRTMFAAIALAAACCGWYSTARNRADLQDPLLTARSDEPYTKVWLERTGPKWLDLVGADHFRRYIVGASISATDIERYGATVEDQLQRISRLPKLRYLSLRVDRLTPAMIEALGEMRQLRELRIETKSWKREGDAKQLAHDCLVAVGKMLRLERLHMEGTEIAAENLDCLAGLTHLKSLSFDDAFGDQPSLLTHLPALPNLEAIDLDFCQVSDEDLLHLAAFPRLRSLGLRSVFVGEGDLADVACLKTLQPLEEITLDYDLASPASLQSLQALKHLKTLHFEVWHSIGEREPLTAIKLDHGDEIEVLETERERFVAALRALRQSNPGMVIDANMSAICWQPELDYRSAYSPLKDTLDRNLLECTGYQWLTPLERARFDAETAKEARQRELNENNRNKKFRKSRRTLGARTRSRHTRFSQHALEPRGDFLIAPLRRV